MTRRFTRFLRRNTVALLALFVALSGTTFAAANVLAPNSVGAKQLKKNAVTSPKIKNNAVNGTKIANDTVKGADVLESSLGKVPSATSADSATTATNATNATNATTATNATNATNASTLGGKSAADLDDPAAYARVVPGSPPTLDPARNKNVTSVTNPTPGLYCFDLAVPVTNVLATVDWISGSATTIIHATVQPYSGCPAGNDGSVRMVNPAGTTQDVNFYVSFFD